MGPLTLLHLVCRELLALRHVGRIPEPDLVMDDPGKVRAYVAAGRQAAVMAPTHLLHTAHMCQVICPGDTVLDLGCGPGTQLAQVASLVPGASLVGLDLSDEMLAEANAYVRTKGLSNVQLRRMDFTDLAAFADQSVDAVISSMTLHHLPELTLLERTFAEVRRVLRPGGGIYLADFVRLRSLASMRLLALDHADQQDHLFTEDYLNSLKAAFSLQEFKQAGRRLMGAAAIHATFPIRILVAVKSRPRRVLDEAMRAELARWRSALPQGQRADLDGMVLGFRLGRLSAPPLE